MPLIIFILAIGYAIFQLTSILFSQDPYMPLVLFSYLNYALPFFFLFGIFSLALIIFYLVHITRNDYLDIEKKFLWTVIVITLSTISMPIYWYTHIWNEKSKKIRVKTTRSKNL